MERSARVITSYSIHYTKLYDLEYIPSCANFVAFAVPREGERPRAGTVYERLLRRGVIVRPVAGYGMPDHLRVTVGTRNNFV